MAVFALATIGAGLLLDSALNTNRRIATLVCVIGGIPINLVIAISLTRLLLSRTLGKPRALSSNEQPPSSNSGDQAD